MRENSGKMREISGKRARKSGVEKYQKFGEKND